MTLKVRRIGSFILLFFVLLSCTQKSTSTSDLDTINIDSSDFHSANLVLEKAIINDYFSPPVASRVYVYPNLAAYEVLSILKNGKTKILQLESFDISDKEKVVGELASLFAFYKVASELVYSIEIVDNGFVEWKNRLDQLENSEAVEVSKIFGEKVAMAVLHLAKNDYYAVSRSAKKYELIEGDDKWKPTPPDYLDALEPEWELISSICLDSASQFRCQPPSTFSLDKSSLYYRELMEVYEAVNELRDDQPDIAKFWDCNPIVPKHQGHVTIAEKKLTPGGHWLNIARDAMNQKSFDFESTVKTYAFVTVGIFDAFISCWEAKYYYNYIRPVTVIQEQVDPDWSPILLTPNFPEYPSGHSVVSGSASTILTEIIGESYHFTDSSEVPFGMEPRTFESFNQAADEAAISRLYGGIHYMPAIKNGVDQGRNVGTHIVQKLMRDEEF